MRIFFLLCFTPLIAVAQLPPRSASGVLLERDTAAKGEFSLRAPDNQVFRFQFDPLTAVQRDSLASRVELLLPGDKIEVVSDLVTDSLVPRARTVVVTVAVPAAHRTRLLTPPPRILPAGSLTFSGVVARLSPQRLTLHTRDGERTFLIRQDTRYVADGGIVEAAALQPNMRVFVRAGHDLYERVEAYQVIWGSIFDPKR